MKNYERPLILTAIYLLQGLISAFYIWKTTELLSWAVPNVDFKHSPDALYYVANISEAVNVTRGFQYGEIVTVTISAATARMLRVINNKQCLTYLSIAFIPIITLAAASYRSAHA